MNWMDPEGLRLQILCFISEEEGQQIADEAKTWVGTPYVSGGTTKGRNSGADCSGSVWKIYQNVGFPFHRTSAAEFPNHNVPEYFAQVPGNIPQVGDVGQWSGHLLIYDPNADGDNDAWSARRPGRRFSASKVEWWGWGSATWHRYLKDCCDN